MISNRSSRSMGIPCGLWQLVPRMLPQGIQKKFSTNDETVSTLNYKNIVLCINGLFDVINLSSGHPPLRCNIIYRPFLYISPGNSLGHECLDSYIQFGWGSSIPGDASVGGHDEHRGEVVFKGTVQEGEALHVKHVDFINEEHLQQDRGSDIPFTQLLTISLKPSS